MKNQKGITLVALIFTIIIMLILTTAAVSIANEGKLFERAREAAFKTQLEADRENLLSEVAAAYDIKTGLIDFDKLNEGVQKIEFTGEDGIYISKSGNRFLVDSETGLIAEYTPE